jgi:hypothetical protein
MKRKYFFLLILLTLILPVSGQTQDKVTAIDSLAVELWPDYDRASVLVMLTGTLPADTKLPATVVIPFPQAAQLNAVARIDSSDDTMKDDISYSHAPAEIKFVTPDLRFRLEYYLPYVVNNNRRTFNFTWVADLSVKRFQLRVQQPTSANILETEPATENILRDEDGLTYYAFPVQAVPAGQSFSVDVNYTMTTAQLSAKNLVPPSARVQEPGLPSTSNTETGVNWPVLAVAVGILIMLVVFIWQIAASRTASNRHITHNAKAKKQHNTKYCRKCGNPIGKDDKFCRKCGTALQG